MLKLLTARAGGGQLETILARMARSPRRQILIAPEQYSHETERALCRAVGPAACLRCEVLSFSRLARRVAEAVGGGAEETLDAGGRMLLMYAAVRSVAEHLTVYRAPSRKPSFLSGLIATVDECKSYQVSPGDLSRTGEELGGAEGGKLRDLGLIFGAYEALTARTAADPRDKLDKLAQRLEDSRWAAGMEVWVWGFTDFTPQEGGVLRALLGDAHQVTVALTCDGTDPDPSDLFGPAKRTMAYLARLAESWGVPVEREQLPVRSDRTESLTHLEQALFAPGTDRWEGPCEVDLYTARSPRSEVERTAAEILRLVREEGYRFRDIAVCARDFSAYSDLVESVFGRYGVPVFLSTVTDILQKPILALVTAALDTVAGDYAYEDVFRYLKTGLTDLSDDDRDVLENYVLTWDIRGSRWTGQKDWDMHPEGYGRTFTPEDHALLERLNRLRRQVTGPLERLRKHPDRTGRGYALALYQCLEDIGLPQRLDQRGKVLTQAGELKLAAEYRQLWDILCGGLEQCALLLNNTPMDLETFAQLFGLVLSQYDVGAIPVSLDRVTAGENTRMTQKKVRVLFWLGADSASVPQAAPTPGLLSDRDRAVLAEYALNLAPRLGEKLRREMTIVYETCALPTRRLYVSWARGSDGNGGERAPSFLIERLRALFPDGRDEAEDPAAPFRLAAPAPALEQAGERPEVAAALRALPGWAERVERLERAAGWKRGRLTLAATTTLYGQRVPLSATKLDKLHACHFQHFLKFGLNAKPRQRAKFQAADYGTFVHFVLEQVLRQAVEEPGGVSALHADAALRWQRVEEAAARYITESLRGLEGETGRFRYLFTRMLRAVHQVVDSAVAELAVSDFQPVAFELGFGRGEGKAMPPIRAENGVEVQVSGYVDRVDAWLHNGTRYLRVVDYKTGKKEFSFTDVKHGMGLQMLLYLFALEKQGQGLFGPEEIVPAGVLYFPARTPIVNGSRSMSDQAIADAVDRDLVRRGVVLGEPEVLQAMEHTEGNFRYLPVGNRGDWLLTAEQMEQLGRLVSDDLKAVAGELAAGNIDADPFWRGERENACQWCDYAQACHFEPVCGDRVRWQKGLSAREFWAALGGGDQPEEDDHGL